MKYDYVYILNDEKYIFQDRPLKSFMDDDKNMDEKFEKVLFLTTELLEKENIEMMKKVLIKRMNN